MNNAQFKLALNHFVSSVLFVSLIGRKMHTKSIVFAMLVFALTGSAFAVPPGMTVEFEPEGFGKVIFSGKIHADQGFKCSDCHPKVFQQKRGSNPITMSAINKGEYCGACHNEKTVSPKGVQVFGPKKHCLRCHEAEK
jgi:c(7)-type cytochrome triheme protein